MNDTRQSVIDTILSHLTKLSLQQIPEVLLDIVKREPWRENILRQIRDDLEVEKSYSYDYKSSAKKSLDAMSDALEVAKENQRTEKKNGSYTIDDYYNRVLKDEADDFCDALATGEHIQSESKID